MTTPINDGGPAFPITLANRQHGGLDGMSLRDWFAGQALAGEFGSQNETTGEWTNNQPDGAIEDRCKLFYRFADAMLKARNS